MEGIKTEQKSIPKPSAARTTRGKGQPRRPQPTKKRNNPNTTKDAKDGGREQINEKKPNAKSGGTGDGDSSCDSDTASGKSTKKKIVPVDFEFFGFVDSDFHAVKRFMTTALGSDAMDRLPVSELTERLLDQPLGTTVKCGDESTDPYAFVTVAGLTGPAWNENAVSKALRQFFKDKARDVGGPKRSPCHVLATLFQDKTQRVGWLVNERMVNMPWQVAAPMFRLLSEELAQCDASEKESETHRHAYDYLVILCPIYAANDGKEEEEEENAGHSQQLGEDVNAKSVSGGGSDAERRKRVMEGLIGGGKRKKPSKLPGSDLTSFVHMEEEYIEKYAEITFKMTQTPPSNAEDSNKASRTQDDDAAALRAGRKGFVFRTSKLGEIAGILEDLVKQSEALIKQERVIR